MNKLKTLESEKIQLSFLLPPPPEIHPQLYLRVTLLTYRRNPKKNFHKIVKLNNKQVLEDELEQKSSELDTTFSYENIL